MWGFARTSADPAASARECALAYENLLFAETIRERLFDSCRILFVIREGRVHGLHIRHQAQDPEDLIE